MSEKIFSFAERKELRRSSRVERKHIRQASRMARYVGGLASRGVTEKRITSRASRLSLYPIKQFFMTPTGFDDEVFERANQILESKGVSVSHEIRGHAEYWGFTQYMTVHVADTAEAVAANSSEASWLQSHGIDHRSIE